MPDRVQCAETIWQLARGDTHLEQAELRPGQKLHESLLAIGQVDDAPDAVVHALLERAQLITDRALRGPVYGSRREFHQTLSLLLSTHASMPYTWGAQNHISLPVARMRRHMWEQYLRHELQRLSALALPPVPTDPHALVEYLCDVNEEHTAAQHPVFDYLRESAPLRDVKSFFYQEGSVDARFDDLIALAQIGTDGRVKIEYAHNFADEMGHGDPTRVHTTMFLETAEYVAQFRGRDDAVVMSPCTEALACSNMQVGMALDRRQVWRLAGYLAAFELNATDRCRRLVDACVRHGMDSQQLAYLTEHIDADVGHAQGLFEEIIEPLAASDARAPLEIAQGFLLRLQTSGDYCDAMLRSFLS